jgi:hypothetical protein
LPQQIRLVDEINFSGPAGNISVNSSYPYSGATTNTRGGIAQAFSGNGQIINQAQICLVNASGGNALNNGGVTLAVMDENFTLLTLSDPRQKTDIGTTAQWQTFHFPTPLQTVEGVKYYLAILNTPTVGNSNLTFAVMTTTYVTDPARAGQMASQRNNTWVVDTATSNGVIFRLLSVVAPLIPTAPLTSYASVQDVERELSGCITFSDGSKPSLTDIQTFITASDDFINGFCGHDWWLHSTRESYDGLGVPPRSGVIFLGRGPVCQVDKVEWWNGHEWVMARQGKPLEVAPSQAYEVYLDRGEVRFYYLSLQGMKVYRVNYLYGYGVVPASIQRLSAILTALKVLASWTGGTLGSYSVGDIRVQYPKDGKYGIQWANLMSEANRIMYQQSVRNFAGGFEGIAVSQ